MQIFRTIVGGFLMILGTYTMFLGGLISGDLKKWPTTEEMERYLRNERWQRYRDQYRA